MGLWFVSIRRPRVSWAVLGESREGGAGGGGGGKEWKRTVRDHDARAAGYRLLGNGIRQVIREQNLGLRRFLAGHLDVVEQ